MAKQQIRIACTGAAAIDPAKLKDFQGSLKSLTNEDYLRLRKQVEDLGFSEPISVWRRGKENFILNGHQRLRTIMKMMEEGWACPPLPVSIIQAKTKHEAKRKLLALTSQYGKIERQGLYEFLQDTDIKPEELFENFRFPDIDLPSFTEEFFIDKTEASDPLGEASGSFGGGGTFGDGPAETGSGAYIKMVQLMFDEERYLRFQTMVEELKGKVALDNLTDICFLAVEEAHAAHCKSPGGPRAKRRANPARENGIEQ